MSAFGDPGLALGALALEGGPGVARWRVPVGAPEALWRRLLDVARGDLGPAAGPSAGTAAGSSGSSGASAVLSADGRSYTLTLPRAAVAAAAAAGDPAAAVFAAALAAREAPPERVLVMGVVNVTPDSFSDGGRFQSVDRALEHGLALAAEGADLLDVGGESTRPGAPPVAADEELRRVLPVVRGLARAGVARISIDTTKAAVAQAAVASGASIVNDVSAGEADPGLLDVVAALGVDVVLMHRQGTPATMQLDPRYGDPVLDVANHLRQRVREAVARGVPLARITLDPGLGFGKRLPHNLALLARLGELRSLGLPLLVGPSRKSFIAHVMEAEEGPRGRPEHAPPDPTERLGGTAAAVTAAVFGGARVIRVHDVRMMVQATRVAEAIRRASPQAAQT